jgi:hypothetical protein
MDKEYIIRSFGKMPEAAIQLALTDFGLFLNVFAAGRRQQIRWSKQGGRRKAAKLARA